MLYNSVARRFSLYNTSTGGEGGDPNLGGGGATGSREAEEVVRNLLARTGLTTTEVPEGARKVMRKLAKENFKYRQKNRDLEGRVAPEGAVILSGDDATAFEAFKALGLKPEEVTSAVQERDTLKTANEALRRDGIVRSAAEALNFKASVLGDLVTSKGLEVEIREVEVEENGSKVNKSLPHVKAAGDEKAKWELLSSYAERDLKDYLPALKSNEDRAKGVQYPEQHGTDKALTSQDVVGKATSKFIRPSQLNKS